MFGINMQDIYPDTQGSPADLAGNERENMLLGEALIGIANVLVEVVPLFVMGDTVIHD